jgi:hypothetical protein
MRRRFSTAVAVLTLAVFGLLAEGTRARGGVTISSPEPNDNITAQEWDFCAYGSCTVYVTAFAMASTDNPSNVPYPVYIYQDPEFTQSWCVEFSYVPPDPNGYYTFAATGAQEVGGLIAQ